MRRAFVLLAVMVVGLGSILRAGAASVEGAQTPAKPPLSLQQLEHDLYVLRGGCLCGNTTFYVTDAGVVMVDTKVAGKGEAILEQLRTVTDQPIAAIINTHTHFDHTGSNAEFGTVPRIVTHENARASLTKPSCAPVTNCDAFTGENERYLPNVTFEERHTLRVGRDQVDLYYFGPGHTNGDLWVVFPEHRTAVGGDLFGAKGAPFIDTENGGTAIDYDQTIANAVTGLRDVETVISGHVDAYPFDDLVRYAEFHRMLEDHVMAGIEAGQTAEAVAQSFELPERLGDFSFIEPFGSNFVKLMFDEVGAQ